MKFYRQAPRFWFQPSGFRAKALAPLGCFYRVAGYVRRAGATPYRASVPVICVGNVVAGGAGKTPTALALAEFLKRRGEQPVFVSRGYGGAETGPLFVDPETHTFHDVGDEAMLLARAAPCWIGRDRAAAVRAAERHASHIILDDGLQNPRVAPSLSLLVIDGASGLGNGKIIPAGPMRETLASALKRTDAVIMIGEDRQKLFPRFGKPVLGAHLITRLPENFPRLATFFAFTGIGRPEKFYTSCREAGLRLNGTRDFPDHHPYRAEEIEELLEHARVRGLKLITTEKDWVRLPADFRPKIPVLPVELGFEDTPVLGKLIGGKG
jgi:tetraacyldisaccharide 4'-kinase